MPTTLTPLTGRTVRCILFDLGNTLWHYNESPALQQLGYKLEQRALAILRRHLTSQEDRARLDALRPEQFAKALDSQPYRDTQPGVYNEADVVSDTLAALRQLGFSHVTPAVAAEMFEALRESIAETRVFFDDALSTLAELKARGFLLGIVSNRAHGGEIFMKEIEKLGLFEYFDPRAIAISIDLMIRKPDQRIFQYTLNALEVSPEEAVMVGDQLGADVYGSQRLGMYGVWMPQQRVFTKARAELQTQGNTQLDSNREHETSATQQTHLNAEILPLDLLKRIALDGRKRHYPDRATLEALQPDMVIEHLSELLNVFTKVGTQ